MARIRRKYALVSDVLSWWAWYAPMRTLRRWHTNMLNCSERNREQILHSNFMEKARAFANDFLQTVDTDGDGGLSLCELKAADLCRNEKYTKAATWLTHGRTFQRFDVNGVGIIEHKQLVEAMAEFEAEQWKFDGVLW